MVDTETYHDASSGADCASFPLWYRILVCAGSAGVGGYFGGYYGGWGVAFSAVAGVGVGILWLVLVSRFQSQTGTAAIFGGMLWGAVVGVIDTFWLHLTGWGLGYQSGGRMLVVGSQGDLIIGSILAIIAGGLYGLVCMAVLQVHLSIKWKGQE